jgi:hypothetical protein
MLSQDFKSPYGGTGGRLVAQSLRAWLIVCFFSFSSGAMADASLLAWWDFETDALDRMGNFGSSSLSGNASITGGSLQIPDAPSDRMLAANYGGPAITEKTIVAWFYLDSLVERGGSVISLQTANGVTFDGIVYAEREQLRWIAGSDFYNRTQDVGGPDETADSATLVQMAAVYGLDNSITLYRNGIEYGTGYTKGSLQTYSPNDSSVSFGLRHTGGLNSDLSVRIEDARIYGRALSGAELSALQVNVIPEPSTTVLMLGAALLPLSRRWIRLRAVRSGRVAPSRPATAMPVRT